jgi:hypothetical protein
MSLIAYSMAGEKMPWLTVHIAFPLMLGAAWAINKVIKKFINLEKDLKKRWLLFGKVAVFVFLILLTLLRLLGNQPPFQGKTLLQLQATNHFIFLLILLFISGYLLLEEIRKSGLKVILDHFFPGSFPYYELHYSQDNISSSLHQL